jgi:cytochrome c553
VLICYRPKLRPFHQFPGTADAYPQLHLNPPQLPPLAEPQNVRLALTGREILEHHMRHQKTIPFIDIAKIQDFYLLMEHWQYLAARLPSLPNTKKLPAGKSQGPTPSAAPLSAYAMPVCAACHGKVKRSPASGVFPGTFRLATRFDHTITMNLSGQSLGCQST